MASQTRCSASARRRGRISRRPSAGLQRYGGYVATAVDTGLDQAGVPPNAPGGLLQHLMIIIGFGGCVALAGRLLADSATRPKH